MVFLYSTSEIVTRKKTENVSLFTEELILRIEKKFAQSQKKKTMQLLLPHTAPSQQELTLRIFTMSYLHHQTNQKSETYKA